MAYGIIYKITNKLTGKSYIGQTIKSVAIRWSQHKYAAKPSSKLYKTTYIAKALVKYGVENFECKPLCRANNQEELDSREQQLIQLFKTAVPNGYNLDLKRKGTGVMCALTRERLSKAQKGKKRGPHKAATIEKIRKANTGRKRSEETRLKLSLVHKGPHYSFRRFYIGIHETGLILGFRGLENASSFTGIKRTAIGENIKNPKRRTNGWTFWEVYN